MKKLLSVILLAVLPCCALAQVLGFALVDGKTKVRIPIEINNNLVVIPVVLNGQLPLKFILDTGVRTAILTEKALSDILNLTYTRKYSIAGPGGKRKVEAYITNNVTLDLPPGVHGEGHAMLVLQEDYLELRNYLGTDVHGILGYEIFSRFIVTIDYEKKELILMQPQKFHPKKRMEMLPISIQDTKPYLVTTVQLSDSTTVTTKLLIDSGASHGLMLEPNTNDSIRVPLRSVNSIIGRGLGGEISGKIGRIHALDLGRFSVKDVIANFPDPNSYMDTLKNSRAVSRNGAIGGEILSRFQVVFNFPAEKMYLTKGPSYRKKFYYNMSGLTLKAKGAQLEAYEITDVRVNSPAEKAGVLEGDYLESINGLKASDIDLNVINSFFNMKPGKRLIIEINRDGQHMRKVFYLENQI